jgi:hypothetical protein
LDTADVAAEDSMALAFGRNWLIALISSITEAAKYLFIYI